VSGTTCSAYIFTCVAGKAWGPEYVRAELGNGPLDEGHVAEPGAGCGSDSPIIATADDVEAQVKRDPAASRRTDPGCVPRPPPRLRRLVMLDTVLQAVGTGLLPLWRTIVAQRKHRHAAYTVPMPHACGTPSCI
jgi:hypothetical protein